MLPKEVKLFFQEGNSDKVYYARIVPAGANVYDVVVQWGRRGSTLSQGKKAVKVSMDKAQVTLERLVREKTNKGYEAMSGTVKPAEVAPPVGEGSASKAGGVRKKVGRVAQLLSPVEVHEVERLLSDDQVLAQQKLDGIRVLCHIEDGEVLPTNRSGQKTTNIARHVLEGLIHLPKGTVVDGEVVGEVYWLFDVLQVADRDVTHHSYFERFTMLTDELEPGLSEPVRVLESALTAKQKRSLYERLQQSSAEGIVFKRKDAPYTPGRGTTQLKCKFVSSADVLLVENAGNAYRMQVYDGGKLFDVGKVFSGTTNESRAQIDAALGKGQRLVAEVRYLYATDDSQLFQPIFVRVRSDKKQKDCVRAQLKSTNREVVDGDGEG
ncbi:MAG: RNA ligase family protein [Archangium sp.]|nr:RNA ligase family protein [Archangium sp.]